jgi:hypothetical protein
MVNYVKISTKVPMGVCPKIHTYPDISHLVFFTKKYYLKNYLSYKNQFWYVYLLIIFKVKNKIFFNFLKLFQNGDCLKNLKLNN